MKSPHVSTAPIALLLLGLAAFTDLSGKLRAQAQTGGSAKGSANPPPSVLGGGMLGTNPSAKEAKDLVKSGRASDAIKLINDQNAFTPDSKEWHFESAQRLASLAGEIAREGKGQSTTALVQAALNSLDRAANAATDNHDRAKAKAATAYIQERFVGDPTAALASYKSALTLDPTDAALKERVELLERSDAILRNRVRPAKR